MAQQPVNKSLNEAVTTQPKKEQSPVVAALAKAQNAMKSVLPKHITSEKMSRLALSVLRTNRKLAETAQGNPESFVAAVLTAGQLGLELGVFGEAHLVPFGPEIVMIPGYQGLVKLALNSGQVVDIYAHEVRANDKFKMTYGLNRGIEHEPLSDGGFPVSNEKRGPITGFYAVAEKVNGSRTFFAISLAEAERTRDESRGYQAAKKYKKDHPWDTHFEPMGRKTAIRRLCNLLPKSPELAAALALDSANDRGTTATIDSDFTVIAKDDEVYTGNPDRSAEDSAEAGTGTQNAAARQETSKDGDAMGVATSKAGGDPAPAGAAATEQKDAVLEQGTGPYLVKSETGTPMGHWEGTEAPEVGSDVEHNEHAVHVIEVTEDQRVILVSIIKAAKKQSAAEKAKAAASKATGSAPAADTEKPPAAKPVITPGKLLHGFDDC